MINRMTGHGAMTLGSGRHDPSNLGPAGARPAPCRDTPAGIAAEAIDGETRSRIVAALRAMLARAESERLELGRVAGAGLMLVLEHEGVRCMLVVDAPHSNHGLSPRELQVARLVSRGATNRATATALDISTWTVSTHLRRIFAKLGVSSRAEMVSRLFGAPQLPADSPPVPPSRPPTSCPSPPPPRRS